MIVAEGNKLVEYTEEKLNRYTFRANFNPIYNCEESELTTIIVPAPNEKYAWDRLGWLLGSTAQAERWCRLDEVEKY